MKLKTKVMAKAKIDKPVYLSTVDTDKNNPFVVKSFNQTMKEASEMVIPQMLFSELIFETDLTILFASAGVGKTMLAVHIAESIARGNKIDGFKNQSKAQPVLYMDFELSDKQFEGRYTEKEADDIWYNPFKFSDNVHRVTFDKSFKSKLTIDSIIGGIAAKAKEYSAKIVFIDNITWINSTGLEQSKEAGSLMKNLDTLKKEKNLTIIVLAHTPKKYKWSEMTLNDLAGSAQLGNFSDSVFSINYSKKDSTHRYIKQLKCRFTELKYHSKNVIPVALTKIKNNFVGIEVLPPENENELESTHLESKVEGKVITEDKRNELKEEVKKIVDKNPKISSRNLGDAIGVNHNTALKYQKQLSTIDRQTNLKLNNNESI